jgi:gliding motility-associated-like protein
MKRSLLIILLLIVKATASMAQSGTWIWMHGTDSSGLSNYGVLGVPSDSSLPTARYQSAYWKDKQGNFWMFGGVSFINITNQEQNDMWKYNPSTNQWAWMNGPKYLTDVNGEFGVQGIPSPNNYPSIRGWGVNCWTDTAGMMWLYGGYGADSNGTRGDLSDLWKFNPNTNEWTWMKGRPTVYEFTKFGTQNVFADSVTPGSIQEVKSSWIDKSNTVHIFGGIHVNIFSYGYESSNHMWQFDQNINQWRWRKGNNAVSVNGVYGTKGVEDTANYPPGRASYTKWMDVFGNFYIFGGGRFRNSTMTAAQTNMLNDTWKYNPVSNAWTWVNGPNSFNTYNGYGPFCLQDSIKFPNPRIENQTSQNDICVNAFWNFGGYSQLKQKSYNDLWLYNSLENDWVRVHGKDTVGYAGIAGAKGIAAPTNEIGGRCGVGIWLGNNYNDLWIFGGINHNLSDVTNDMWHFIPDSNCFRVKFELPLLPPNDTAICKGENSILYNVDTNWLVQINPNNGVTYNTDSSEITFKPSITTTYTMIAIDENTVACVLPDTLYFTIKVDTLAMPTTQISDFSKCAGVNQIINLDTNYTYSWWQNNGLMPNADTSVLTANLSSTTTYNIIVQYKNKCSTKDTLQVVGTLLVPITPSINLPNTTFCIGDSIIIPINNNYIIDVQPATNFYTNADTTLLILKPITNTIYTINVTNAASPCTASIADTAIIFVEPPLPIALGPFANQIICVGQLATIVLPSNHAFIIKPDTNILLNNFIFTASPTSNTIYTITVLPNNSCESATTETFQLDVVPMPNAAFNINPTVAIKPNNQIQLLNQSINATDYQWYLNPYFAISKQYNVNYKLLNPNEYCFTLVASNQYNCRDTATHCITYLDDTTSQILYVPNAFSPNDDGQNDVFKIYSKNISLKIFSIYNRWGNQVFTTKNIEQTWDGYYSGKKCDVATYFFYIQYKTLNGDIKELKGDISLLE